MPRVARQKSPTGIYHVMVRGINRDYIFDTDEEKEHFLEILLDIKADLNFELYAYVLMNNHLHLLIKETSDDIGNIMKRIGVRYASWYNKRHDRIGHLFQDRFKSEVIVDENQLLVTLRYIMQNPVKAKLCNKPSDYSWSSWGDYITNDGLTDVDFVLQMFSANTSNQIIEFSKFINIKTDNECLDFKERPVIYD
jgi:REP element-mobilizing transposase RayT